MAQTTELEKLERRHAEHPDGRTFAPLANAYRKRGDIDRALALLGPGLERHPGYIGAQIVLGLCHADLGADDEARRAFTAVLESDPENVIAIKGLADIAERAGRLSEARERLRFLLDIDRGNPEAREQLERLGTAADTAPAGPPPEAADAADDDDAATEVGDLLPTAVGEETLDEDGAEAPEGIELTNMFSSEGIEPEAAELADVGIENSEPAAPLGLEPGEFDAGGEDVAPLEGLESGEPEPGPPAALGDMIIEREADITLEVSDRNEFQMADAAQELAASVQDDDQDEWGSLGGVDVPGEPASFDDDFVLDAPQVLAADGPEADDGVPAVVELLPGADDAEAVAEPEPDSEPEPESARPDASAFLMDEAFEPPAADPVVEPVESEAADWADDPDDLEDGELGEAGVELEPEEATSPAPAAFEAAEPEAADPEPEPTDTEPAEPEPAVFEAPPAPPVTAEPVEAEPDLVVTETMAEIYERQGLHAEALRVYRALAERRPRDADLVLRIQRLEEMARGPAPAPAAPARPSWAASSGGSSVGAYFRTVLGAGLSPAPAPSAPAAGHARTTPGGGDAAPTRPAADPVNLGAVFGEEMPPSTPAASQSAGGTASGFSFDAFFGSSGGPRPEGGSAPAAGEQEDLAQFHAWLQSLKR